MNKENQLGMNPGTASNRLVKDLLFDFIIRAGHKCFQCGKELKRDNFSIEHKKPWLYSENPTELYFDLNNIAYSHLKCNCSSSRRMNKITECGHETKYKNGCRCEDCKRAYSIYLKKWRSSKS